MKIVSVVIPLLISLALPSLAGAMSVEQLQTALTGGERLTFIDVRSNSDFQKGHISGAINIPARLCPLKQLPPLGAVVVYGDGLNISASQDAMKALNEKAGIDAELLDGGYSRWQALALPTTDKKGMTREQLNYISYQQLVEMIPSHHDLTLVDLRIQKKSGAAKSGEAPVDLTAEFPGARIKGTPFQAATQSKEIEAAVIDPDHNEVYVLIDSGDGQAEKIARRLKAAGVKRFVILAGGEAIIARKGQPGKGKK